MIDAAPAKLPSVVAGLALLIILFCVYYPVYTSGYLYHDDWIHFYGRSTHCSAFPMYGWFRLMGRPVGHDLLCLFYGTFETIDRSGAARLIVVAGIASFAILQLLYFQVLGMRWLAAAPLALGTSVLPGVLVCAYWIGAGFIVFSLLASVAAVVLADAGVSFAEKLPWRAALVLGACVFQTLSLLIYQTGAMYFWTLTALMLTMRLSRGPAIGRLLATYISVGAAPMGVYYLWFRYLSGLGPILEAADPQRGRMFQDLGAGVKWFLTAALPQAAALWFIEPSQMVGLAIVFVFVLSLILVVLCMWWPNRHQSSATNLRYLVHPLVIIALGGLTFCSMLVSGFRLAVFRSLVPLSALIFLCGAVHLGMLLRVERWPRAAQMCIAASFTLGVSCLSVETLVSRMIVPASAESSYVRNSLLEASRSGNPISRVHAIVPKRTRRAATDEIDNLTVQFVQDIEPMIRATGRELGLHVGPVSFSFQGEPFERDGAVILNFPELSKTALWGSVAPRSVWLRMSPAGHHPQRPYAFVQELRVDIESHGDRGAVVRFTDDGTMPTLQSQALRHSIRLTKSTVLKAQAFVDDAPTGPVIQAEFTRLDEDGAVATGIKRGGDQSETIRVAVRPGGRIALIANDANDGIEYDQADWAEASFECLQGRIYLSQVSADSARQDWGSLAKDRNLSGHPIQIRGHVYHHGLAVNANAELVYPVPPACSWFVASVGIDDSMEHRGSVRFVVRPVSR